jgi:hypothetical protein
MFPPEKVEPRPEGSNPIRRRAAIIVASLAALIIGAVAGAGIGIRHEREHWTPLYNQAVTDYEGATAEVAQWKTASQQARQTSERYRGRLEELQKRVSSSVGNLSNPHFVLWNSCGAGPLAGCPLLPGREYIGGVPDTFTYSVSFHSTVPVTVRIMSSSDFVCWETRNCTSHYVWWPNRTRLVDGVFHNAEGCAGYFAVFSSDQAGILYPNVSIDRHPASHLTGVCR